MNCVDLEVSPIKCPVCVGVVDLAIAPRILRALDSSGPDCNPGQICDRRIVARPRGDAQAGRLRRWPHRRTSRARPRQPATGDEGGPGTGTSQNSVNGTTRPLVWRVVLPSTIPKGWEPASDVFFHAGICYRFAPGLTGYRDSRCSNRHHLIRCPEFISPAAE